MAAKTEAQEEFDSIIEASSRGPRNISHPENRSADEKDDDNDDDDLDEEEAYRQSRIDETMRIPTYGRSRSGGKLKLPPASFDSGCTTGVKGVIADARSYELARLEDERKGTWRSKAGLHSRAATERVSRTENAQLESDTEEDEEFLELWRENRREQLKREGNDIRNRRTSPSSRLYGRFDEVDALGYLDAIEKVGRDVTVVVFVYDPECPVSEVIEAALAPLVPANPSVHFVKVHYEDIEFDNAGVPAILAYKNQGDLFANLTYVVDQIPEDTLFDTQAVKDVLRKHGVL